MIDLEQCCAQLYGHPKRIDVDPADIPCMETSDPKRLCKHPLVSVRIITYNHEPYIRKCIESVLMQETDFEYEIVIGEDCSTDRTREICFSYQKSHPDKVRVLWANVNVFNLGGNQARSIYHSRGKYLALIEGDDYWTDPRKLQKQIDLIRKTNAIGCVANYQTLHQDGTVSSCTYHCGDVLTQADMFHYYPHTATYVFSADAYREVWKRYPDIHCHYDVIQMHCFIDMGPVAHLDDIVSVYRLTGSGIATGLSAKNKQFLGIKQYLDLYLHGPKSCHRRFGSQVVTYIALMLRDMASDLNANECQLLKSLYNTIVMRQFYDARTIRAIMRRFFVL